MQSLLTELKDLLAEIKCGKGTPETIEKLLEILRQLESL